MGDVKHLKMDILLSFCLSSFLDLLLMWDRWVFAWFFNSFISSKLSFYIIHLFAKWSLNANQKYFITNPHKYQSRNIIKHVEKLMMHILVGLKKFFLFLLIFSGFNISKFQYCIISKETGVKVNICSFSLSQCGFLICSSHVSCMLQAWLKNILVMFIIDFSFRRNHWHSDGQAYGSYRSSTDGGLVSLSGGGCCCFNLLCQLLPWAASLCYRPCCKHYQNIPFPWNIYRWHHLHRLIGGLWQAAG